MIVIYTPDLTSFTEIQHAVSFKFTEYYNQAGVVSFTLVASDENVSAAQVDGVIYDTETQISAIIEDVEIDADENKITINAETANAILNRRVFASSHSVTNVESDIYTAINSELRSLNVSTATATGLSEEADGTLFGGAMLDQIIPILEAAGLGQKCEWDTTNRRHVFKIYKGTDRTSGNTAITFSDIDGTASGLEISDDISEFFNVAYVEGEFNDDIIQEVVGTSTGAARREVYVKGMVAESDETESEYRARLRQTGAEELAERVRRKSFNVEIDPSEYRAAYYLGDTINCLSHRFGFSFTAKITCVSRTLDVNGESMTLQLGEPKLTIIDEVKLKWQT